MKHMFVFILVVLLSYYVGKFIQANLSVSENVSSQKSICDLIQTSCDFLHNSKNYTVSFLNKPSALQQFSIELIEEKTSIDSASIVFEMPDMEMALNHYQLKNKNGHWMVSAILPVCALGRNDWLMKLTIKDEGKIYQTEFSFTQ